MRFAFLLAPVVGAAAVLSALPGTAHADQVADNTETAAVSAQASTDIRFATFNVRTSRADRGTANHWLRRAGAVAQQIQSKYPDVVALQELGPGRADGQVGTLNGAARQTDSLLSALRSTGAGEYKLVRTTPYVKPGTSHGTQGARILYNSNKVTLVSKCAQTTGKSNYNSSCSIELPIMKGDSKSVTRSAAYAEFEDKKTGRNFFVVSVHLDERHNGNASKERKLDDLRRAQASKVYNKVVKLANGKPILLGGDLNAWKTKQGGNAPLKYLAGHGFKDAVSAKSKTGASFPTINHFKQTLKANAPGRQVALDVVLVKGGKSISHYENVFKTVDSSRPSDHNMVFGDLHL